jgi:hypothetical protein
MRVIIEHTDRTEELTESEINRLHTILMTAEEFDSDSGEQELAEEVRRIAEKLYGADE